jgi:cytochrome c biogenesis protein
MDTIYRALRSLRLTVVIGVYMAACCIIGSLYPSPGVFSSIPFYAGVAAFFINLLACAIFRFSHELGKKRGRNFGPDILHAALLLFIISACVSGFLRIDLSIWLFEGQNVELPNGCVVAADSLAAETYNDGRPKEWISTLTVTKGREILERGYPLRVNHPLKVEGITLYQFSWGASETGSTYTVLRAVYDPAVPFVFASLALFGVGTCAALFGKLYRQRRTLK